MKTYQQLIVEGRGNYLYHGTSLTKAASIIRSDVLKAARFWGNQKEAVSLSRSFDIAMNWGGITSVVFVLDRQLLATKYKISPINWGAGGSETRRPGIIGKKWGGTFAEERIDYDIDPVSRYLVELSLPNRDEMIEEHRSLRQRDPQAFQRLLKLYNHPKAVARKEWTDLNQHYHGLGDIQF